MKNNRARVWLTVLLSMLAVSGAARTAQAQAATTTNVAPMGPLGGLVQLAKDSEEETKLPVKLCGLLWPNSGKHGYPVKSLSMPSEHEARIFCVRTDNQDVVIVHRTETPVEQGKKTRKEYYYRTTAGGELTLELTATFEYEIDDVDNELLKKMVYTTYGEVSGDGKKPLAMTESMRTKFEAEKKFWTGLQKKLEKMKKKKKKDE